MIQIVRVKKQKPPLKQPYTQRYNFLSMLIISTQCFDPKIGGIETVMWSLASYLHNSDMSIMVFADHVSPSIQEELDTIAAFAIHGYSGFKPFRRRKKASDINKFIKSQQDKNAFILLADTWKSLEYLDASLFSKIICLAHGSEIPHNPSRSKRARIERAYGKTSVVIANSNYTAKRAEPYVTKEGAIKVIYPGITTPTAKNSLREEIGKKLFPSQPIIITVARLEPRKNQQAVIMALPFLTKKFPSLL